MVASSVRRLVYSVGVLVLAASAASLLIAFKGITDRLIPLYAVGAFLAFTLSQSGMVVHWMRYRGEATERPHPDAKEISVAPSKLNSRIKLAINAVGAVATASALVIILSAKFREGAWITILVIPVLLTLFRLVRHYYASMERQLHCNGSLQPQGVQQPVMLVPISGWNKATRKALQFAMHLSRDVIAIHLTNLEGDEAESDQAKLREQWKVKVEQPAQLAADRPPELRTVSTPYREFVTPLIREIERMKESHPNRLISVVIPEVIERRWWLRILHSRHASRLRTALRDRNDMRVVVVDVPWFLEER